MKPALNEQTKARFFAQYLGQKVLGKSLGNSVLTGYYLDKIMDDEVDTPLNLRPLSDMTDEEARILCDILMIGGILTFKNSYNTLKDRVVSFFEYSMPLRRSPQQILSAYQYLISIGIAVEFNGHSVEELISAGYCKVGKEV